MNMNIPVRELEAEGFFDHEDISRDEAIRAVGVDAYNFLERAADRKAPFFSRVKNFFRGENKLGRRVGMLTDIAMFFLPSGVTSGRQAVQRIIQKEARPMPVLNDKAWYQSKTLWSAVIIAITGTLQALGVDLAASPEIMETIYQLIYTLAGGFGLYGLRDAVGKKMKDTPDTP